MLMAEKLKTVSSVKIKEYGSNSKRIMLRSHQKGSILLGIIITMVVMASLGAGMLYLTTTSTFQELFANNHARAYYAAESGGRYAMAEIRYAYTTSLASLATNLQKTFNIGNGGSFEIKNLSFNGGNPETVTFDSIGTVGSGFMTAKRQIKYSITPANQTLGGLVKEYSASEMDETQGILKGSFGTGTDGSIHVVSTVDDGNNQDFAAAYFNSAVNFLDEWNAQNQFLSYDAQVKVKSETDYFSAGLGFRLHTVNERPRGFHVDFMRSSTYGNDDGLPAAIGELKQYPGMAPTWAPNVMEVGATYIILWFDDLTRPGWETLLAYKRLDEFTSGVLPVPIFLDNMEVTSTAYVGTDRNGWTLTGSTPWGWITGNYNNNNSNSGTHSWNIDLTANGATSTLTSKQIDALSISTPGELSFAYKVTNHTNNASGTVKICTGVGNCTTVFTLPAGNTYDSANDGFSGNGWFQKIILLSGITLTSSTYIQFSATTTGTGQRLTWYVDDVKLAQAAPMPNWSTLLVNLEEKNVTPGDNTTRRNVIKVYYSTPTSNPPGTINWPPATGITLVTWDWVKPNSADPNIDTLMDKTLVQTKYYRTTASATLPADGTGWYNVTNAYDEVGLTVFGKSAAVNNNVFFRDFFLRIGGGGGNLDGSGEVVQY